MAYEMLWASAFYMPYSRSANVLTITASICGLWGSFLDFQEFNEVIWMLNIKFLKRNVGKNPEDFLGYDAKFAPRGGKGWLLFQHIS